MRQKENSGIIALLGCAAVVQIPPECVRCRYPNAGVQIKEGQSKEGQSKEGQNKESRSREGKIKKKIKEDKSRKG